VVSQRRRPLLWCAMAISCVREARCVCLLGRYGSDGCAWPWVGLSQVETLAQRVHRS